MRAHLGEFGIVVAKGIHNVERLIMACEQAELPAPARKALSLLADQLIDTQRKIEALTADIRASAKTNEDAQRLQTIPGIGPITRKCPRLRTARHRRVQVRQGSVRLAGPDAKTTLDRRQGAAGTHLQE